MNTVGSRNHRGAGSRVWLMHEHHREMHAPYVLHSSLQKNVPLTSPAWVLFPRVPFTYRVLTRNPKTKHFKDD